MKEDLKKLAVNLRRRGLTYSEILAKIPVAKSTLSLWLRSVSLAKKQYQRLTRKRLLAQQKGATAKHQQRLDLVKRISEEALKEMCRLDDKHLWLAGIMLYWAEGSKAKEYNISQQTQFTNSDPKMIKLFLLWLGKVLKIQSDQLVFSIFIHTSGNVTNALNFWSKVTGCDIGSFRVYFKKHKVKKTNRKNTGEAYFGILRVTVRKSANLNRKITAWVNAICKYWGVV